MIDPAELVIRCQQWLMDEHDEADEALFPPAYTTAQVRTQLAIEASRLANQRILGTVVVAQAVVDVHAYPLDAMGIRIAGGFASGGSVFTISHASLNFVTLGVIVGDRVRDLTDGSTAIVTGVATGTLTADAGFLGGVTNLPVSGNLFVVEHPLDANRVVEVAQVYYSGVKLVETTESELDVRRPGWETWSGEPRYWLADGDKVISTIRVVPSPTRSGSTAPVFPMNPFILDWHDNLMIFLFEDAQDAGRVDTGLLDRYEDMLVYNTVGSLAGRQGEYENGSLAQIMPQLAALWAMGLQGGAV